MKYTAIMKDMVKACVAIAKQAKYDACQAYVNKVNEAKKQSK